MKSAERMPAKHLVTELLQAEKATKHQHRVYPLPDLVGHWRLDFVTGTRKVRKRGGIVLGAGRYVPTWLGIELEIQAIPALPDSEQGELVNRVRLGALGLELRGPSRYIARKNILAFNFTHLRVTLGALTLYERGIRGGAESNAQFNQLPIAQLPCFAFFLVQPDRIAARGRGGGLAQWVRRDFRPKSESHVPSPGA